MKKFSLISLGLLGIALASCGTNTTTSIEVPTVEPTTIETIVESTIESTTTEAEAKLSYRKLSDSINSYYAAVDTTLSGEAFRDSVSKVISVARKYSYSEAYKILAEADEDPYNKDNIICHYTGKSIPKNLDTSSKAWNREHTFPKSHGFNHETWAAYTDCHHLVATENKINSIRGDLDFDEVTGNDASNDSYGNYWTSTAFEPRDEEKGDIARRLFYMATRYNDENLFLEVVDDAVTSTSDDKTGKLGKLSTLLKWHYEDPVSDDEIKRNEVIYSYQQNRNPYIDHPEWVNLAYASAYTKYEVKEQNVLDIVDAIEALPAQATLEDKDTIDVLYEKVSQLNAQERLYVNNYYKLTKANSQVNYLMSSASGNEADIYLDFSTVVSATTNGYKANHQVTINNYKLTASCVFIGEGAYRLGTNGKSVATVSLSKYGLSETGAYLNADFSVAKMKKIRIEIPEETTLSTAIAVGDGTNYQIAPTKIVTENGKYYIVAELDSAYSGTFALLVYGSTSPRIVLSAIEIYTE